MRKYSKLLLLLFTVTISQTFARHIHQPKAAIEEKAHGRMIGGEKAKDLSKWRFMLRMEFQGGMQKLKVCSASIISNKYAITTARCINNITDHPQLLTLYTVGDDPTAILVSKIIAHPKAREILEKDFEKDKEPLPIESKNEDERVDNEDKMETENEPEEPMNPDDILPPKDNPNDQLGEDENKLRADNIKIPRRRNNGRRKTKIQTNREKNMAKDERPFQPNGSELKGEESIEEKISREQNDELLAEIDKNEKAQKTGGANKEQKEVLNDKEQTEEGTIQDTNSQLSDEENEDEEESREQNDELVADIKKNEKTKAEADAKKQKNTDSVSDGEEIDSSPISMTDSKLEGDENTNDEIEKEENEELVKEIEKLDQKTKEQEKQQAMKQQGLTIGVQDKMRKHSSKGTFRKQQKQLALPTNEDGPMNASDKEQSENDEEPERGSTDQSQDNDYPMEKLQGNRQRRSNSYDDYENLSEELHFKNPPMLQSDGTDDQNNDSPLKTSVNPENDVIPPMSPNSKSKSKESSNKENAIDSMKQDSPDKLPNNADNEQDETDVMDPAAKQPQTKLLPTEPTVTKLPPIESEPTEAAPSVQLPNKVKAPETLPTKSISTNSLPTKSVSTMSLPSKPVPTKALPTKPLPTKGITTKAVPTKALPTEPLPTSPQQTKPTRVDHEPEEPSQENTDESIDPNPLNPDEGEEQQTDGEEEQQDKILPPRPKENPEPNQPNAGGEPEQPSEDIDEPERAENEMSTSDDGQLESISEPTSKKRPRLPKPSIKKLENDETERNEMEQEKIGSKPNLNKAKLTDSLKQDGNQLKGENMSNENENGKILFKQPLKTLKKKQPKKKISYGSKFKGLDLKSDKFGDGKEGGEKLKESLNDERETEHENINMGAKGEQKPPLTPLPKPQGKKPNQSSVQPGLEDEDLLEKEEEAPQQGNKEKDQEAEGQIDPNQQDSLEDNTSDNGEIEKATEKLIAQTQGKGNQLSDKVSPEQVVDGIKANDDIGNEIDYDIALLEFKTELNFELQNLQAIALPSPSFMVEKSFGLECNTAGWGSTKAFRKYQDVEANNYTPSPTLQEINQPIVQKQECEKDLKGKMSRRQFCAGSKIGNQSPCLGDAGSPLVCNEPNKEPVLQGLISGGSWRCDQKKSYAYLQRISSYRSWIDSVLLGKSPASKTLKDESMPL